MQPGVLPPQSMAGSFSIPHISIPEPVEPEPCSSSHPISNLSTATAASAGTVSPSSTPEETGHSSQQWMVGSTLLPNLSVPHNEASEVTGTQPASHSQCTSKEWMYRLVTFPSYFTPCVSCCGGSRIPKREQLMTQYDTSYPYKVYCSHCPDCKDRSATLLQVRRSAFKDVVKATDIQRFGADVAGVQQYTLNGSKVIYLNREQTFDKKNSSASTAPAQCSVDGRAMMDKGSQYCSLKCKMHADDPEFNRWLDQQDPSVRLLAQAAAHAPPRPTAASKRAHFSSSSDGNAHAAKTKKLTHISGSGVPAATTAGTPREVGSSEGPVSSAPVLAFQQQVLVSAMQRASSAVLPGVLASAAGVPGVLLMGAGLRSGPHGGSMSCLRQHSAPSAFLETALVDPPLAPSIAAGSKPSTELEYESEPSLAARSLNSCSFASWECELSSPLLMDNLDNLDSPSWDEECCLSDTLKPAASCDWWVAGISAAAIAQDDAGDDDETDGQLLIPGLECLSGAALIC